MLGIGSVSIAYLLGRHDVICGHFSVRYLSNEVLESAFVFSFLRDPLERVLSAYGYFRDLSLESSDPESASPAVRESGGICVVRNTAHRPTNAGSMIGMGGGRCPKGARSSGNGTTDSPAESRRICSIHW